MLSHRHHLFISPQLNSEPVNTCFYTGLFHNTRERHARGILVGATGSVTGPYRQASCIFNGIKKQLKAKIFCLL